MTKKNKEQELVVVSKFFEEAMDWEQRYKALKKTIKNLKKFSEAQAKGPRAEA